MRAQLRIPGSHASRAGLLPLPGGLDFNERLRREMEESLRHSALAAPPNKPAKGGSVAINLPSGVKYVDRSKFTPIQEAYYQATEFMHRKEWQKAAEVMHRVIELGPEPQFLSVAYTMLGMVYARARNNAAAADAFQEAIRLNENVPNAHLFLGTSLMLLHRYEEAVGPLQKALEQEPELTHVNFYLGHIYNELGRYEEAVAAYGAEIAAHPKTAEAYKELAQLYVKLGDSTGDRERYYPSAIETYKKWTEQSPEDSATFNFIGYLYSELGQLDQAVGAYEQALKANPDNVIAFSNLGTAYLALGRNEEARGVFERVTGAGAGAMREQMAKLSPNPEEATRLSMAEAYQKLGASLLKIHQAGQADETRDPKLLIDAEAAFNAALRYVPDDIHALHGLGLVYYGSGRRAAAVRQLRKVLGMDSGNEDAANNLRIAEVEMQRVRHWLASKAYRRLQQCTDKKPVYSEDVLDEFAEGLKAIYGEADEASRENYFTSDDLLQSLMELMREIPSVESRADLALRSVIRQMLSPTQAAQLAGTDVVLFLAFLRVSGVSLTELVGQSAEYERDYLEPAIEALGKILEMNPESERTRDELQALTELRLDLKLRELGLLREVKKPITDFTPYENRTLIAVQGRPVSETLLEDRG
jgi:tetratricopeptide (TPR) repeat protein